jgi:hypothetical protein
VLLDQRDHGMMLHVARECRHPDALCLCALFPVGATVTMERVRDVMREQGEDPRAMFFASCLGDRQTLDLLRRSAELGYAPAQAVLSQRTSGEEAFLWAQRAAAQGDRHGICELGHCFALGWGCAEDSVRAVQLYREAAELAQISYGKMAFGELHWQRFLWLGRAAAKGEDQNSYCVAVRNLLGRLEKGQLCQILHTVAPVIKNHFDAAQRTAFGDRISEERLKLLQKVIVLHEVMLFRAKLAIDCWSVVGRRCGVVKDIRVVISKMAWAEPWRWAK